MCGVRISTNTSSVCIIGRADGGQRWWRHNQDGRRSRQINPIGGIIQEHLVSEGGGSIHRLCHFLPGWLVSLRTSGVLRVTRPPSVCIVRPKISSGGICLHPGLGFWTVLSSAGTITVEILIRIVTTTTALSTTESHSRRGPV
jgi:hypothetical protein